MKTNRFTCYMTKSLRKFSSEESFGFLYRANPDELWLIEQSSWFFANSPEAGFCNNTDSQLVKVIQIKLLAWMYINDVKASFLPNISDVGYYLACDSSWWGPRPVPALHPAVIMPRSSSRYFHSLPWQSFWRKDVNFTIFSGKMTNPEWPYNLVHIQWSYSTLAVKCLAPVERSNLKRSNIFATHFR